jgi:hypothetical protein
VVLRLVRTIEGFSASSPLGVWRKGRATKVPPASAIQFPQEIAWIGRGSGLSSVVPESGVVVVWLWHADVD